MQQRSLFFLLFFLLIGTTELLAQSGGTSRTRAQLEREKADLQKRINEFDRILQRTTASRQASISELNLVNQKLQARLSLINNLNKEINLINAEVREKEQRIRELEKELKALKEEYARMIYYSAKLNQGRTLTAFIFSSNSVKQLFLRLNYLRQYAAARKRQVARMETLSLELKEQKTAIEQRLEQRKLVLKEEEAQRKALADAKKEQERMVASLRQQEDKIKKDLAAAKKQQESLNRLIRDAIAEEIRLAEAKAKKEDVPVAKAPPGNMPMTPEVAALSASFAGNRGKLPWPVASGFISQKFGSTPHPTLKGYTIDNDGIDIQTTANADVRAVFDGVVMKVATVPGYGGTVLIKHGEYFTMYSRLKTISVKSGQTVKARDVIGKVATNKDGISEVHFETWKGLTPMNPASWLAGK